MTTPSVRVFIAGNSGSGKTTRAWNLYLSRMPRRIIVDQTGEWKDKGHALADTLSECVDAVRELAPDRRWTVIYTAADDNFRELVRWLLPVPDLDQSPAHIVGGIALLCDEVDLLAPYGPPPEEIRNLYRRSRHAGLTVISCTQRPGNVSREVSAQSNHIIAHYLTEPRDRDYIADAMRWNQIQLEAWLAWTRQNRWGAVWKEVQTGRTLYLR